LFSLASNLAVLLTASPTRTHQRLSRNSLSTSVIRIEGKCVNGKFPARRAVHEAVAVVASDMLRMAGTQEP
jgi:hypothetical protein